MQGYYTGSFKGSPTSGTTSLNTEPKASLNRSSQGVLGAVGAHVQRVFGDGRGGSQVPDGSLQALGLRIERFGVCVVFWRLY